MNAEPAHLAILEGETGVRRGPQQWIKRYAIIRDRGDNAPVPALYSDPDIVPPAFGIGVGNHISEHIIEDHAHLVF